MTCQPFIQKAAARFRYAARKRAAAVRVAIKTGANSGGVKYPSAHYSLGRIAMHKGEERNSVAYPALPFRFLHLLARVLRFIRAGPLMAKPGAQ